MIHGTMDQIACADDNSIDTMITIRHSWTR